jgi:hypothetical protein
LAEFADAPTPLQTSLMFSFIAAGSAHACALTDGGTAYCWGSNGAGRLGATGGATPTPVAVSGGLAFQVLSAGGTHTCGLTADGEAYCWGNNGSGQLGVLSPTSNCNGTCSVAPVPVSGGVEFASLAAGGTHSCGITTAGAAYCWGSNAGGQLGNGQTISTPLPVLVVGDRKWLVISAGGAHTCALTTEGAAYCWGRNDVGQLGLATSAADCPIPNVACATRPLAVATNARFSSISAGTAHNCALTREGAAVCWGANRSGQLGNGDVFDTPIPQAVEGALLFTTISAGGEHSCGLTQLAVIYCWGDNFRFQIGASGVGVRTSRPVAVVSLAEEG